MVSYHFQLTELTTDILIGILANVVGAKIGQELKKSLTGKLITPKTNKPALRGLKKKIRKNLRSDPNISRKGAKKIASQIGKTILQNKKQRLCAVEVSIQAGSVTTVNAIMQPTKFHADKKLTYE